MKNNNEYFVWNMDEYPAVYIYIGETVNNKHLWKCVYDAIRKSAGITFEVPMGPKDYKDVGITVINKTQFALLKLNGKWEGKMANCKK